MKVLYIDCGAGICGDMLLAAFVDLGVGEDYLRSELGKLGLPGWRLCLTRAASGPFEGLRADVELAPRPVSGAPSLSPARGHGGGHRSYREIAGLIERCDLADGVKFRALAIYRKLAEAEAEAHGESVETVHFHEVGDADSILDIVGAAICLESLEPNRVVASTIELGGGSVRCRHGLLQVPAPAVAALVRGLPTRSGSLSTEATTPTGAAFLAATVDEYSDNFQFRTTGIGRGIGHRDLGRPGALELRLGELES